MRNLSRKAVAKGFFFDNSDGNPLVLPHTYDLDVVSYIKFLDEGVAAYKHKTG